MRRREAEKAHDIHGKVCGQRALSHKLSICETVTIPSASELET